MSLSNLLSIRLSSSVVIVLVGLIVSQLATVSSDLHVSSNRVRSVSCQVGVILKKKLVVSSKTWQVCWLGDMVGKNGKGG